MSQAYDNRNEKKQQVTEIERFQIEALVKARKKTTEIAELIGKIVRTIQREIKRGQVTQLTSGYEYIQVYKVDAAQRISEEKAANKGRPLKIGYRHDYAAHITERIVIEKCSPEAANEFYKKEHNGEQVVCTRTLYSYIRDGLFYGLGEEKLPRGK